MASPRVSSMTDRADTLERFSAAEETDGAAPDEPVYILQPVTYTPQASAASSPTAAHPSQTTISPGKSHGSRDADVQRKRRSLRDRVSLKVQPPESIQVPPPGALEFRSTARPSPSPRPVATSAGRDSAYGSDVERMPPPGSVATNTSISDMSPRAAAIQPPLMSSPRSDQQRYFPVQASPHSPLQQRPWTSGDSEMAPPPPRSSSAPIHHSHVRNKPSAMNMSMLSNVTSVSDLQSEHGMESTRSTRTDGKKKRSAFGWFKKAFSLDEEEGAQFEKRKRQYSHDPSMDARKPQYMDGKRVA